MRHRAPRAASATPRVTALLGRHRLLLVLLVLDIATKVTAFHLLPQGKTVSFLGLPLYLAVNEWGVMGGVHGIGAVTDNPAYTMLLAFGLIVFAGAILRLGASSLGFGWRVFAGTVVFLAVAFVAQAAAVPLGHVTLPHDVIVATIRFAALAVSVAFYAASSATFPRTAFTLLAAGAVANAASYAYPPFEVVDFVMVPLQPLAALLGRGSAAADGGAVGVINLADMYLFAFPLVLIAWPAWALLARMRRAGAR